MLQTPPASRPDWGSYNGMTMQSGSNTLIDMLQRSLTSMAGPMIGGLINRYVIGTEFNRQGNLASPLSGIVMPSDGGTYSGAFLNMLNQSRTTSMFYDRADM